IEHMTLANPHIIFKFESESKKFASPGEGIESAVFAVYGDAVLKNLVKTECEEQPIYITGYTCLPSFTKPSKNYQNIIINGRYVESADISYAVYSVYAQYLMKRQYPLFVLHITMPFDMVDVNVHPSKLQVKFADTTKIKSLVARSIKNAINPRLTDAKKLSADDFKLDLPREHANDEFFGRSHSIKSFFDIAPKQSTDFPPNNHDDIESHGKSNDAVSADVLPRGEYKDVYESAAEFKRNNEFVPTECKYVGKLFNTYLVLERGDMCYFVDQHAAHEKLLYDKLLADYEQKRLKTQPMILPFVFDVSPIDAELITENLDLIESCGFGISPFGEYTFSLSYVPYECAGIDLQSFVSDMLLLISSREKSPMVLKERLMQAACKAAVKGEIDDLSQSEIDALLAEMSAKEISLFCPHGRPIVVCFTKKEIEKWFKRIV
ncbi:MAG: hypothetical protein J1G04_05035, partial [Clostridiales bacterium]|nr:hypothetical protein [Clostridiales bacterium]